MKGNKKKIKQEIKKVTKKTKNRNIHTPSKCFFLCPVECNYNICLTSNAPSATYSYAFSQ